MEKKKLTDCSTENIHLLSEPLEHGTRTQNASTSKYLEKHLYHEKKNERIEQSTESSWKDVPFQN